MLLCTTCPPALCYAFLLHLPSPSARFAPVFLARLAVLTITSSKAPLSATLKSACRASVCLALMADHTASLGLPGELSSTARTVSYCILRQPQRSVYVLSSIRARFRPCNISGTKTGPCHGSLFHGPLTPLLASCRSAWALRLGAARLCSRFVLVWSSAAPSDRISRAPYACHPGQG